MLGFIIIVAVLVSLTHIITHVLARKTWQEKYMKLSRIHLLLNTLSIFGMGVCWGAGRDGAIAGYALHAIAIWFMFQIILSALLLAGNLLHYGYRRMTRMPVDESRRRLAKGMAVFPCVAAGASLYGGLVEKDGTVIRSFDVPVEGLGSRLEGFSLAQLSDVHLGPFFNLDELRELLEKTAAQKPDVLVITGDLFDDAKTTMKAAKLLDSYVDAFPRGLYYCRGNHEHFRGIALLEMALSDTRIHNMVNTNELVVEDDRPLYIAGADYPMQRDQFDFLQDAFVQQAMDGVPENAVKVLLAHHPDFVTSAAEYGTELVLSGHTHGGQLGCMGIPLVPPVFKYLRGWYQVDKTRLYVHCGNGSWFPFRLGCPPEIAIFKLKRA